MSTPVPEGSIIITPAQVYAEVRSLTEAVRTLITHEETDRQERLRIETEVTQLDLRVDALERKLWMASGFCAAAGSLMGVLVVQIFG